MATNPQAAHRNGYEKTDASPRGLVYFAASIAVIVAATSLSLIWLFNHFEKAENTGSFVATPFSGARPLPPPPRIQPNPGGDMQSYFQSQQNLLQTYGWIDRQNGFGGFWATQILPFGDPTSFIGYMNFETAFYQSLMRRMAG